MKSCTSYELTGTVAFVSCSRPELANAYIRSSFVFTKISQGSLGPTRSVLKHTRD